MPVSRKRKKVKSNASARSRGNAKQAQGAVALRNLLTEGHRHRARAQEVAEQSAAGFVGSMTKFVEQQPGQSLEDEMCARLGPLLVELERHSAEIVSPDALATALVPAAGAAVEAALRDETDSAAAWRVLATLVGILPGPFVEGVAAVVGDLRELPGGEDLPDLVGGRALAGEVRWARDRYGCRFAVVAPFATQGSAARWYLWDVDACTYRPVTVHSGFYDSPEEAFDNWRVGVGSFASAGVEWTEVDDASLLGELLPQPEGPLWVGGESAEQYAEYLRGRRLAEALLVPAANPPPARPGPEIPSVEAFVSWHGQRSADPEPEDLQELAETVAEMWPNEIAKLWHCCSPHRVAHAVLTIRTEIKEEFAGAVVALMADWITWLAERAGTPSELVEHALTYARGEIHPDLGDDARTARYQARVIE